MKKIIKFQVSLLLILSMLFAIETPMTKRVTVEATIRTQAEAVAWVNSQINQRVGSGQCVALIQAYYSYLGVTAVSGNGCDYAWNSLPSGWSRVQGGIPQQGDILVYSASSSNPYGHVAIYESDYVTYHQNFNSHQYVEKITNIRYNGFTNAYWGYIRPNWSSGNIPQGCIDSITAGTGYIDVRGWAFDKDSTSASLAIHVYVGGGAGAPGAECHMISANQLRTDVNNVYGISGNHGFSARIYTGKSGNQPVYIYALNLGEGSTNPELGNGTVSITKDATKPTISNVKISNIDASGYTISCTVSDNCKVSKVLFPSWNSDLYGGNDAVWIQGTISGNTASARINISTLKGGFTEGHFVTHVYAYDLTGNTGMAEMPSGVPWVTISKTPPETTTTPNGTNGNSTTVDGTTRNPSENETKSTNNNTVTNNGIANTATVTVAKTKVKKAVKKKSAKKVKITLKKIKGVVSYQIQISNSKKFKKKLVSKTVIKSNFTVKSSKIKNKKKLYVRARACKVVNGNIYYGDWSKVKKVKVKK